jgi:hypothetical protein
LYGVADGPGIQKQYRMTLFSNGFYCMRAPGQTAQGFAPSGRAGLNLPHPRAGVEKRDALCVSGKSGDRTKDAEEKRDQKWNDKLILLEPVQHFNPPSLCCYPVIQLFDGGTIILESETQPKL